MKKKILQKTLRKNVRIYAEVRTKSSGNTKIPMGEKGCHD